MKKLVSLLLALCLCAGLCSTVLAEGKTVKIGATPVPHAEILELIKDDMAAKGFPMEIVIYTDYPLVNPAVADGSLDANYFQHHPYLDAYNESAADDQKLMSVIDVHYEPFAIYPGKTKTLEELQDGATISVTNDPSNEARALLLLESAGLIKLKEGAGLNATIIDIVENPHNLNIVEIDAAQLARTLPDVDFAVINGNFALDAGLNPTRDAAFIEPAEGEAAKTYTNLVAVRPENAEADWVKALQECLNSQKVYDYITTNESFKGGVVPAFTVEAAEAAPAAE
jgi:D-methionine transport system substrate-binding protein